jgi:hypothetical protein
MVEVASGDARRRPDVGIASVNRATGDKRRGPKAALSRAEGAPGPGERVVRVWAGLVMGTRTAVVTAAVGGGRGVGSGGGGGLKKKLKCGRGTVQHAGREGVGAGTKFSQM